VEHTHTHTLHTHTHTTPVVMPGGPSGSVQRAPKHPLGERASQTIVLPRGSVSNRRGAAVRRTVRERQRQGRTGQFGGCYREGGLQLQWWLWLWWLRETERFGLVWWWRVLVGLRARNNRQSPKQQQQQQHRHHHDSRVWIDHNHIASFSFLFA